jgi:hypothetical protein
MRQPVKQPPARVTTSAPNWRSRLYVDGAVSASTLARPFCHQAEIATCTWDVSD